MYVKLVLAYYNLRGGLPYPEALDDHRVLVVVAGGLLLAADGADVLAERAFDDHDLPLDAVSGDAAKFGSTLAPNLQE